MVFIFALNYLECWAIPLIPFGTLGSTFVEKSVHMQNMNEPLCNSYKRWSKILNTLNSIQQIKLYIMKIIILLSFSEEFMCPPWTIKCPSSYCIPLRYRCNDVIDCPGGEDEHHCGKTKFWTPLKLLMWLKCTIGLRMPLLMSKFFFLCYCLFCLLLFSRIWFCYVVV